MLSERISSSYSKIDPSYIFLVIHDIHQGNSLSKKNPVWTLRCYKLVFFFWFVWVSPEFICLMQHVFEAFSISLLFFHDWLKRFLLLQCEDKWKDDSCLLLIYCIEDIEDCLIAACYIGFYLLHIDQKVTLYLRFFFFF